LGACQIIPFALPPSLRTYSPSPEGIAELWIGLSLVCKVLSGLRSNEIRNQGTSLKKKRRLARVCTHPRLHLEPPAFGRCLAAGELGGSRQSERRTSDRIREDCVTTACHGFPARMAMRWLRNPEDGRGRRAGLRCCRRSSTIAAFDGRAQLLHLGHGYRD